MTKIGVITYPSEEESYAESAWKLIFILQHSTSELYLLAGGVVSRESPLSDQNTLDVGSGEYTNISLIDYIIFQIHLSYILIQQRDRFDLLYFQKGAMGLLLPVLTSRILLINTCVIKIGAYFSERTSNDSYSGSILTCVQKLSFLAADSAIVFTQSEVETVPNRNTYVTYTEYVDFEKFSYRQPFNQREVDLGFVGRFSSVKRARQVAEAATQMCKNNPQLSVRFVGDGPLYDDIEGITSSYDQIELTGWVEYENMPQEYNDMKVLIAASRTEGLPTALIEAMGCGVVVVSPPVGSIGDLITDGVTGVLFEYDGVDSIVEAYNDGTELHELESLSENARKEVYNTYSEPALANDFERITDELMS